MRALLLDDASSGLRTACEASGLAVVRARSVAEARALLGRGRYDLVDARLARPLPLEEEIHLRLDLFYERLRGHTAAGLHQAVLREVERPLIRAALRRARGVRSAAAEALGIDRGTLVRRMRALGLTGKEPR
jgi:Fis family transcriptional regulator, factor for inversion stimulation protein